MSRLFLVEGGKAGARWGTSRAVHFVLFPYISAKKLHIYGGIDQRYVSTLTVYEGAEIWNH